METACIFDKYGHCKYRETCRKLHYDEICEKESCEKINCDKRHPKSCTFFSMYNRCKFGTYCSFSHVTSVVSSDDEKIQSKLSTLEERMENLENEIKLSDAKVQGLLEENKALEKKLDVTVKSIKDICAITVKKAVDDVVDVIFKKQDENEKKQQETFDLINKSIKEIIAQSQPSRLNPQPQSSSQSSSQPESLNKFQCVICGKSFGSSRALTNHERKDHQP